MILECPECSARYLLSASAIGESGRDVRCTKCQHQWFQEPKTPEPLFDPTPSPFEEKANESDNTENDFSEVTDEDFNAEEPLEQPEEEPQQEYKKPPPEHPIPDAVKPLPEGSNVPAFRSEGQGKPQSFKAKLMAWMLSLGILFGFLGYMVVNKERVLSAWPASNGFYDMIGLSSPIVGEGLIIEKASATIDVKNGKDVLIIRGNILNLKRTSKSVPLIKATMRDEDGMDMESFEIVPSVNIVEPAASFPFTAEYLKIKEGVASVNLTFQMNFAE